ncbi:TIR domain-containing protein [candidate division KSB1 bacterium]|nr:TIR domain-containing protein [candidate division KSB1 bacterium]
MLGAKDLNISIEWRFRFYGHGARVHSEPGVIYVDLGNRLEPGIIDHHIKESPFRSSASAIAGNSQYVSRHLLGGLNDTYYRGQTINRKNMIFTFACHRFPDWDSMVSFYLCRYICENGYLPPQEITDALSRATDIIDQGEARVENNVNRPFLIYLMMMNTITSWEECLQKGAGLIDYLITSNSHHSPALFLDPFEPPEMFAEQADALKSDYELFQADLQDSDQFFISVPTTDGAAVKTRALAFKRPPRCRLHKYWIREHSDVGVLLVPFENKAGKINRVIISVDPDSRYSLLGLGYLLEKAESEKRKALNLLRRGVPRYEAEYCDNDDPWYDGRGHNYTIVDSPRNGTVLSYAEIIKVVSSLYSQQDQALSLGEQVDGFISYRRQGGTDLALAIKVFLESNGKTLFLDVESLKTGKFPPQLTSMIERSKNFILILSPDALNRRRQEEDWLYSEISQALAKKKNIIPVMMEGFDYPRDPQLLGEISDLINFHGVRFVKEHYAACFRQILENMV